MKVFIALIALIILSGCSNTAKKNELKKSDKDKLLQTKKTAPKQEKNKNPTNKMTVEMVPVSESMQSTDAVKVVKKKSLVISDVTAETALGWLKNGNTRYVKRLLRGDGQDQAARNKTYKEQRPHAIILSPSDSRVPPEIIFDQKLGEIAVVRSLAASLDTSIIGSIEHTLHNQGPQLLVILSQVPSPIIKKAMANLSGKDLFSPENQDKMAIAEIEKRAGITTQMLKDNGITQGYLDILAPIWASMPYSPKGGASYYGGQPSKPAKELKDFYKQRLGVQIGQNTPATPNVQPGQPGSSQPASSNIPPNISSGTGGKKERDPAKTKIAGDLGRYIYKTLTPQAKASDGVGDFSYASEHPDFGGSFKRSYDSWHNYDRAIDIGGFWPQDQTFYLQLRLPRRETACLRAVTE